MSTALAIANALAPTMGVRLKALPLTSEHVRAALAGRKPASQEWGAIEQHASMSFFRIEGPGSSIGLTLLPQRLSMQLMAGDTAAETSAALEAEWRLSDPYSQGKTLGREQCMWWD
jgi:hypothetical protein